MGFRSSSLSRSHHWDGQHRFEHWYRDNSVYFITARVRDRALAFRSSEAKDVFWTKFDQYTREFEFIPWITTLMDNHYHTMGYLKRGENLGILMRRLHGSIAKLTNDLLDERITPFWYERGKQGYFDGCLRDEVQGDRTYRYIHRQSVRHGICRDWREYPHTRIAIDKDRAIRRATELNAWMRGVRYKRYDG